MYRPPLALAAAADEPEDDKPSSRDDDDDDDDSGLPKPFTSSPPSSSRSLVPSRSEGRSGDSHHGGDRDDVTHVGTSWSQTGDMWWTSASGDHHEIAFDDSSARHDHNGDEYDDGDNDDGHDEESAEHAGDY